jgi:hypothetical protein
VLSASLPRFNAVFRIEGRLVESIPVEMRQKRIDPGTDTFDPSDPQIKRVRSQWLSCFEQRGCSANMIEFDSRQLALG